MNQPAVELLIPHLNKRAQTSSCVSQTRMRSGCMRNLYEIVLDCSLLRLLTIVFLVLHLIWLQTMYYFPAAEDAHHHDGEHTTETHDEKHVCTVSCLLQLL